MDADKQCSSYSKAVHFLKDTFTPPPCPLPVAASPHGEGEFWGFRGGRPKAARPETPLFPLLPRRGGGEGGQGDEGALKARPCLHEVWI